MVGGKSLISIHAPRVGSDSTWKMSTARKQNFNPRSPCGERQDSFYPQNMVFLFQSTLPVWGATGGITGELPIKLISIHAPRVGSDQALILFHNVDIDISIHAPRVGSDFPLPLRR